VVILSLNCQSGVRPTGAILGPALGVLINEWNFQRVEDYPLIYLNCVELVVDWDLRRYYEYSINFIVY
jgi:hypothetical protein